MANAWILAPLPIPAAAASNTAAGRAPVHVGNDYAGVVWQSNGEASPWIVIDLGGDLPIDTVSMFGLAGISTANTLTIQTATAAQGGGFGGGSYTAFVTAATALAGATMPLSGKGVSLHSIAAPVTCRYVKIAFTGLAGAIQIARCVIGKRIVLERNFSFGGARGVRDLGSVDFSARGVLLRRSGKKLRTAALTFSCVNKDEVEAHTQPLIERLGNTETAALFTDPAPDPQRQNRAYFGFLVGDLAQTQRNARAWEAKLNVVSIF